MKHNPCQETWINNLESRSKQTQPGKNKEKKTVVEEEEGDEEEEEEEEKNSISTRPLRQWYSCR